MSMRTGCHKKRLDTNIDIGVHANFPLHHRIDTGTAEPEFEMAHFLLCERDSSEPEIDDVTNTSS